MKEKIKVYYNKAKIPPDLLEVKLQKFEAHVDIACEFAYWIENKKYISDQSVTVDGYTAESLSRMSPFLIGEGSFMLLIELREDPERAHQRISEGFKIK